MVLVFQYERGFLVFCPRSCILFGFPYGVFLRVFLRYAARFCPMCVPGTGVIGIAIPIGITIPITPVPGSSNSF